MKDLEKLEKEYDNLSKSLERKKESILEREKAKNPGIKFLTDNWKVMIEETLEERIELRKKRFEIECEEEIKWDDIPPYGDLFTKEEFRSFCEEGGFLDSDGFGNYASKDKISNIEICPSDFKLGTFHEDPEFTHIVWFNK